MEIRLMDPRWIHEKFPKNNTLKTQYDIHHNERKFEVYLN